MKPNRPAALLARLSLACLASLAATAHADEGMWMPSQLPRIAEDRKSVV